MSWRSQDTIEEKSFKRVEGAHDIVLPIEIPPLRGRRDDVPILVEYFIDSFNTRIHEAGTACDTRRVCAAAGVWLARQCAAWSCRR
jgi:transcriptional regulator with AAA-type ATPase domain